MKFLFLILFFFVNTMNAQKYCIVIHGGAGNITKENTPNEKEYFNALDSALKIGESILKNGGKSLDAVEKVVRFLEDCDLFNAGKGAVLTEKGTVELDASIMDGKNLMAGAVAGVKDIKNPISAARAVMEKSQHVLLIGEGASEFARNNGLELVPNEYFITNQNLKKFKQLKDKNGTVGCVALDIYGNLAAGTSTGGMMMKKYGRVGDSPIIGAGTYANNNTCAVSCTGHGEYFIRNCIAFNIHSLMLYKNYTLQEAVKYTIDSILTKQNGTGGIIAIDKHGNYYWDFNTKGMFRAAAKSDGEKIIELYSK